MKQNVIEASMYINNMKNIKVGSELVSTARFLSGNHFTVTSIVTRMIEIRANTKILKAHAVQWSHDGKPIIFIAS